MDVAALIRQQQASGFPDIAGAQVTATVPVNERLINQVISANLPKGGALRHAELHAHPGERLTLRVTLAKPAFVPPFNVNLQIERQAQLPDSPVIVLRIAGAGGLMAMAGSIAGLANGLPPGMRLDGDRIVVDLRAMLRPHGADGVLDLLEELYVATGEGTVTLAFRARVG
ncbi:MAG TPA: hypothetical protein VF147_19935 [Vicinamibacterales bacterium]